MKLQQAQQLANTALAMIEPYCTVCMIAGSIRREKDEVKDIEIVCVPKVVEVAVDMFSKGWVRHPEFYTVMANLGPIVKGHPSTGRQVKVNMLHSDSTDAIMIDVFIATPENFGYIYMLRTGSSEWNRDIMIPRGKKLGFTFADGIIWYRGKPQHTPDEESVFRLLNMQFVPPQHRRV